jgi:hypothetical protein
MATSHFTTTDKFEAKLRKLAADHNTTLKDTERQILSSSGTVSGGTYKLGYGGDWTGNLAFNATAGAIQTALEGIFAAGDIFASGGPLPGAAVNIRWGGTQQHKDIGLLEIDIDSLTGGGEYEIADDVKGRGAAILRRLESAYDIIQGVLMKRGLTDVQISTWQRGEEFQLDIATYWYGRDSGWAGKADEERDWLLVFNREKELTDVPIVDNTGVLLESGKGVVAEGINLINENEKLGYYP